MSLPPISRTVEPSRLYVVRHNLIQHPRVASVQLTIPCIQSVGARSVAAHAAWQVPNAALQATIDAGAEAPRVAPHVNPAAE